MKNFGIKIDQPKPAMARLTWTVPNLPEQGKMQSAVGVQVFANRPPVDFHWDGNGTFEMVVPSKEAPPAIEPFSTDPRCSNPAMRLPEQPMGPSCGIDQRVHYTRHYAPQAAPPLSEAEGVSWTIDFDMEPNSAP